MFKDKLNIQIIKKETLNYSVLILIKKCRLELCKNY